MRRFYVEDLDADGVCAIITGPEFVHLKRVLRLKVGDDVSVFNGRGVEFDGIISGIDRAQAIIRLTRRKGHLNESPVRVTLIQGLVKAYKPDFIMQKAVELGVNRVFFYHASRSNALINGGDAEKRLLRWKGIAVSAAKQCGRATVPDIRLFDNLKDAARSIDEETTKLFFLEAGVGRVERTGVKEAFKRAGDLKSAALLIGPEGGFSEADAEEAVSCGFAPIGLGQRTLRAETAALVALAIVQYEFGDVN